MPGAPNRPPEVAPPPPNVGDAAERRAFRRLVPSHLALLAESWKGGVPPEVAEPFFKAEAAWTAGDIVAATSALDHLAIRFAEPRWPTLPEPWRRLRVAIPAPVPPHWDPDHGLAGPEKEARKARREAGEQLLLADGAVAWAGGHGIAAAPLSEEAARARSALGKEAVGAEFYPAIDRLWETLRVALPRPKVAGRPAPPAHDAP